MTITFSKRLFVGLLLLFAITGAAVAGYAAGRNSGDEPSDPETKTDASDIRLMRDVKQRYDADVQFMNMAVENCEKPAYREGESLGSCFDRDVEPLAEEAERQLEGGLREIMRQVGPACRLVIQREALEIVPGEGLRPDAGALSLKTCKREAAKSS